MTSAESGLIRLFLQLVAAVCRIVSQVFVVCVCHLCHPVVRHIITNVSLFSCRNHLDSRLVFVSSRTERLLS